MLGLFKKVRQYKFFIPFLFFILISSSVFAVNLVRDYNNPLTRSIADSLYCLLNGCTIAGDLIIEGDLTIIGDINNVTTLNVNGSLLPSIDDTFDVGSSSSRWQDGFFSNDITALRFIGELKDGFRNENFTTRYGLITTTFDNENFSTRYDLRGDRFDNENFSAQANSLNSSLWNKSGTTIYLRDGGNNVSIGNGNTNAGAKLVVWDSTDVTSTGGGALRIGGSDTKLIAIDNNEIQAIADGGSGTLFLNDDGGTVSVHSVTDGIFQVNTQDFYISATGDIGIGTSTPAEELVVIGNVNISGTLNISGRVTLADLASCDSFDTDANGVLSCGSDNVTDVSAWNFANNDSLVLDNSTIIRTTNLQTALSNNTDANFSTLVVENITSPHANKSYIFFQPDGSFGIMLDPILPSVSAQEEIQSPETKEFTRGTERTCNIVNGRKVCNLVLYSGTRFVFQDNTWVDAQDARSLKEFYSIKYLKNDGVHDFEIVELNQTSIELKVFVKDSKELDKDIPFKVDDVQKTTKRLTSLLDKPTVTFTSDNILGSNYTFGIKSTTIILQDADTANLDDSFVISSLADHSAGGETNLNIRSVVTSTRRSQIKFNILSPEIIPTNQIIDNAKLYLFKYNDFNGPMNISVNHFFNRSWTEGAFSGGAVYPRISWNNHPCGTSFNNGFACNLTNESVIELDTSIDLWYNWTVTNMVQTEYNDNNPNVSIVIKATKEGVGDSRSLFRSKEFTTDITKRPYLNITYSTDPSAPDTTPPTFSTTSINNTSPLEGEVIQIGNKVTDDRNLSMIIFAWNDTGVWVNFSNSSVLSPITTSNYTVNITLTAGGGVVGVQFYANDTSDNWGSSAIRTFGATGQAGTKSPRFFIQDLTNGLLWFVNNLGNSWLKGDLNISGNTQTDTLNVTNANANATFQGDVRILGTLHGGSDVKIAGVNITVGDLIFPDGTIQATAAASGALNSSAFNKSGTDVFLSEINDNFGIGTSSPGATLDVNGDIYANDGFFRQGTAAQEIRIGEIFGDGGLHKASGDMQFNIVSGGNIKFTVSDSTKVFMEGSTGNVGIGTTGPNVALEVIGSVRVSGSFNASAIKVGTNDVQTVNAVFNKVNYSTEYSTTGFDRENITLYLGEDGNASLLRVGNITDILLDAYKKANYSDEYAATGFDNDNFTTRLNVENASLWQRSGTDTILVNTGDNVGIGNTIPNETLQVSGDIYITGGLIKNNVFWDYAVLDDGLVWREYDTASSTPTTTEGLTTYIKAGTFTEQAITTNIDDFTRSDDTYAVEFVGYFYANETGSWSFGVNSDDGSDFFIDGKLVAFWYGGHGANVGDSTPGGTQLTAYLETGYHRLYTRFQEKDGGDSHEILYKIPGGSTWAIVPASLLFHHPNDLLMSSGDNLVIMSGNIGIGTTIPSGKLVVIGDVSINDTDGTSRMFVDVSSGNIGIGTATPVSELHIYVDNADTVDSFTIEQDGTGDATMEFLLTGLESYGVGIDNDDGDAFKIDNNGPEFGSAEFQIQANNDVLLVKTGGNVGIGTTSPDHKLSLVGGNISLGDSFSSDNNLANPTTERIVFDRTVDNSGDPSINKIVLYDNTASWAAGIGVSSNDVDFFTGANFRFYTGTDKPDGTGSTERLTILSAGNIGIGNNSPEAPLQVQTSSGETTRTVLFRNINDGTTLTVENTNPSPSGFSTFDIIGPSSSIEYDLLTISNDGTDETGKVFTVQGNGNIGIGTNKPTDRLQVMGNFSVRNPSDATDVFLFISNVTGNVGIGTNAPTNLLTVVGSGNIVNITSTTSGDANILLEADLDNNNEDDNPTFILSQDGNRVNGLFGLMGATDKYTGALDNALFIEVKGTGGTSDIQFVTGGTTIGGTDGTARMTILQDGKVGFGVTNPTLDVTIGDSDTGLNQNGDGVLEIYSNNIVVASLKSDGSNQRFFVIQVDNSAAENPLCRESSGEITRGSAGCSTSSIRYKQNIQDLNYGLKELMQLKPIAYEYKTDPNRIRFGMIAEAVEKIFPEIIGYEPDDSTLIQTYDKRDVQAVLIKAIQEQQAQIEELKQELEALSTEVGINVACS